MAADGIIGQNVNEVINVSGITGGIGEVILKLQELDAQVESANKKPVEIIVQLKGAETLQQLTQATIDYRAAAQQLGLVQKTQSEIMEQYGVNIVTTANNMKEMGGAVNTALNSFANLKASLTNVGKEIANLQNTLYTQTKAIQDSAKANTQGSEAYNKLTASANATKAALIPLIEQQKILQIQVSNSSKAFLKTAQEQAQANAKIAQSAQIADTEQRKATASTETFSKAQIEAALATNTNAVSIKEQGVTALSTAAQLQILSDKMLGLQTLISMGGQPGNIAALQKQIALLEAQYVELGGVVQKVYSAEEIAEQKAAIVNKNMLDKKAANAADLLQKQQAFGDAYNALLLKQAEAEEKAAVRNATTNAQKEANAADLLIKQNAYGDAYIALLEQESIAEQIAAIKNKNTIDAKAARETRAFNVAWEQGEKWQAQQANIANKATQNASKEVAAIEKQSAAYRIMAQFQRVAFRFPALLAEIAIFTLLFEAISKVGTALAEQIPGTDAYIAKEEKMTQATDSLKTSFQSLGDELIKFNELQRKLNIDTAETLSQSITGYKAFFDEVTTKTEQTLEDLKRAEGATKAKGFDESAPVQQFNSAEARRKSEIKSIQDQIAIYKSLTKVLEDNKLAAARGSFNPDNFISQVRQSVNAEIIPPGFLEKIKADIEKSIKDKGNIWDAVRDAIFQYQGKGRELGNQSKDISQQSLSDETAQHNDAYDKRIELEKTLAQLHEQIREANEKEDVASIDKIVGDIQAKYRLLYEDLEKQRKKFIDNFTGDKNDSEYIKAVGGMSAQIDAIRNVLSPQEQKNAREEFLKSSSNTQSSQLAQEASAQAGISKYNAGSGTIDYSKMTEAIDDEKDAKIKAENAAWKQFRDATIANGRSVEVIDKEHGDKLKQIESENYQERLQAATDYFQKSTQIIRDGSALSLENLDTASANAMAKILRGKGGKSKKESLLEDQGFKDSITQNTEIKNAAQDQLPAANEALDRSQSALNNAKTPDEQVEASKQLEDSKKQVADLNNIIANSDKKIAQTEFDMQQKKLQGLQEVKDQTINLVQETADAIKTIQDNEYQSELNNLDQILRQTELNAQIKEEQIQSTTNFQIVKNNELSIAAAQAQSAEANIAAQERAISISQAKFDRQNAIDMAILNGALGVTKIWATYGDSPILAAALTALEVGVVAAQIAKAESVPIPTYAEGTTNHPGGLAIIGDGGEKELIQTPSGESFWSKPESTLVNLAAGSSVTPISKMIDYAASNIVAPTRVEMQNIYNNQVIMNEVAKIIGIKFDESIDKMIDTMYATRTGTNVSIYPADNRTIYNIKRK